MKTKIRLLHSIAMLALVISIVLSACSTPAASSSPPKQAEIEATPDAMSYKEFSLPFPEDISFQLPEEWDFWGNAGYLSPDDDKTYAGVRLAWIEEGRNAEELLYNEGSTVHEKTNVMIGDLETHRYIVEVILTSASTGEVISHTYEMIYAFPAPDGKMVAGVAFSAPTREELEPLVPIAEHMVESLRWNSGK
ncbi:MAG TPA: hypothetical protein VGK56_00015 [Anaerolineales bacterium]